MSMTHHLDDLDQLLDSALDDFQTLNQRDNGVKKAEDSCEVQGLGMGLPDLKSSKKKGKQKAAASHVSETLNKLREQTKETVKGLESVAASKTDGFGIGDDALMLDDWVKQFEELTGSQELESMMENMMQQIMSKEVVHEPMKEIEEKYQKWLQDNKSKLSKEEYERSFNQHELIKDVNAVYESEPGNANKIAELMQDSGQPPNDITKEEQLAPDFDISAFGQLSQHLLHSQENCCIM